MVVGRTGTGVVRTNLEQTDPRLQLWASTGNCVSSIEPSRMWS
jgi:hypothetical protein